MIFSTSDVMGSEDMDPGLYLELNKAWKNTCRILFGQEIGELRDFEPYLKEHLPPIEKRNSYLSEKTVSFAMDDYCKRGRFISLDEIREKTIEPLSINEVKDIDTIARVISEKWEYAGDKILGNSNSVESSDLVMDSQNVVDSSNITESSNVFASSLVRHHSKNTFGCIWFANGEFVIKAGLALEIRRCFESYEITKSSDLYLSHNCHGCQDLMFCFHQHNKRNRIGNLELPKEKYTEIKRKLLGEMADELKKHRRFTSIFELVPNEKPKGIKISVIPERWTEEMKPIEKAFSSTFKILFKKEAEGVRQYGDWLSRHLPYIGETISPFGIKTHKTNFPVLSLYPNERVVSEIESLELAKLHLNEEDITSLAKIKSQLAKIGFFAVETRTGENSNVIESPIMYSSSNLYKVLQASSSENCAFDTMVLASKYVFGCYRIISSEFCINCHNSMYMKRCFEMDASTNCSDAYFCHDCEGLSEAMFCFNTKAKRHAIGNAELSPDGYRKIKDVLIQQMANELEKKKNFKWDIYNIGCYDRE